MCLLDIVEHMWRMGEIHQEFGWTILVLIPKGTTDTRVIGLIETLWKMVEALIDIRLRASLQMHNVLHRFRTKRGTWTAIMELKLSHKLVRIDQEPLFLIFLDLRKAYETVYWYNLIIKLEGYGAGPRMCGILETFWYCQQVVTRQNVFHGSAFHVTRGTTQGILLSPMMLNVVVENFIRTWLAMTVEDQRVAKDGMRETIGRCLSVFYGNYGMMGSHNLDWLQHAMNVLVGLFRRYGLADRWE